MTTEVGGDRADLVPARVSAALRAVLPDHDAPVVVVGSTRSTNDDARAAAAAGAPALSVFLAEEQTRGRGRGGRSWHSPPGANLYLSLLLRPGWEPSASAPFALVVGLVVADAIDARLGDARAQVKWPNDVLVEGRKIAGVLLEASIQEGRMKSLVVGVGVDVHARVFPPELEGIATSLVLLGARSRDRAELAAELVARVSAAAEAFGERGIAPWLPSLRSRDALLGRAVKVEGRAGEARGLDDQGRLLLLVDGAIEAVIAGHVEIA